MPYNVPTTTTDDISFGPAVVYVGAAGSTPATQVGAITEDGVTLEITSEKRVITQGNPRVPLYTFVQAQGVMVKFTSIEWNFENFAKALGAGVTTVSASEETFAFGGDPINTAFSMHIEHYMAQSGNTMNVYVWEAASESGITTPFGQDEHQFELSFMALRKTSDWGGTSLPAKEQLIKFVRAIT